MNQLFSINRIQTENSFGYLFVPNSDVYKFRGIIEQHQQHSSTSGLLRFHSKFDVIGAQPSFAEPEDPCRCTPHSRNQVHTDYCAANPQLVNHSTRRICSPHYNKLHIVRHNIEAIVQFIDKQFADTVSGCEPFRARLIAPTPSHR